jgi:hypothetical protein
VPLPKVRGITEEEMFKVVKTGKKTAKKGTSYLLFLRARSTTRMPFDCHWNPPGIPTEIGMGNEDALENSRIQIIQRSRAFEDYCLAERLVRHTN